MINYILNIFSYFCILCKSRYYTTIPSTVLHKGDIIIVKTIKHFVFYIKFDNYNL